MDREWLRRVEDWRAKRDQHFAMDVDSPIPDGERIAFGGLSYFPPDEKYAIRTDLHRYQRPEDVTTMTTKGITQYLRLGYFEFPMNSDIIRLQVYTSMTRRDEHLFVSFRDWTSGEETYSDGRYVDPESVEGEIYALDFNCAYNPDSAYNESYVRQLAPRENWIPVEIRAGEKRYRRPAPTGTPDGGGS